MQKHIAKIISVLMIGLGIFLIFLAVPYMFIWAAFAPTDKTESSYLEKAYKTSIFKFQKVYTIDNILPALIIKQDYNSALLYIEELEKMDAMSQTDNYFAAYAYCETGEYKKALKYAQNSNSDRMIVKVYTGLKEFDKADNLISKMIEKNPQKVQNYLYKAELELAKGNYAGAEVSINKTLPEMKQSRQVWEIKSKIAKHYGRTQDLKEYENILRQIEFKIDEKLQ